MANLKGCLVFDEKNNRKRFWGNKKGGRGSYLESMDMLFAKSLHLCII